MVLFLCIFKKEKFETDICHMEVGVDGNSFHTSPLGRCHGCQNGNSSHNCLSIHQRSHISDRSPPSLFISIKKLGWIQVSFYRTKIFETLTNTGNTYEVRILFVHSFQLQPNLKEIPVRAWWLWVEGWCRCNACILQCLTQESVKVGRITLETLKGKDQVSTQNCTSVRLNRHICSNGTLQVKPNI